MDRRLYWCLKSWLFAQNKQFQSLRPPKWPIDWFSHLDFKASLLPRCTKLDPQAGGNWMPYEFSGTETKDLVSIGAQLRPSNTTMGSFFTKSARHGNTVNPRLSKPRLLGSQNYLARDMWIMQLLAGRPPLAGFCFGKLHDSESGPGWFEESALLATEGSCYNDGRVKFDRWTTANQTAW